MYIDFDYYISNGGTITDESTFTNVLNIAEARLDYITFNRIAKFGNDVPEKIKFTVVQMIEKINSMDNGVKDESISYYNKSAVSSMSNNGISLSFENTSLQQEYAEVDSMVSMLLANIYTPDGYNIMYRGFLCSN